MSREWYMPSLSGKKRRLRNLMPATRSKRDVQRKAWWTRAQKRAGLGSLELNIRKQEAPRRFGLVELDALARSIGRVYEYLPAEGKKRCMDLVKRLGDIRGRLL